MFRTPDHLPAVSDGLGSESRRSHAPLDPQSAETRDLLEALDDAMFAAIFGDSKSLKDAAAHWSRAVEQLDWELLEESREHFLRFAVEVTRQFEWGESRDPVQAMAAIAVIELLTR